MIRQQIFLAILFFSFAAKKEDRPFVIVMGTAQDAGYPQTGCKKGCCMKYYSGKLKKKSVSCLALIDPATNQKWMFDATPDFTEQFHELNNYQAGNVSGIFLTHAHIGHYTGLMYLGREAMNAKEIPVYTMPRMHDFLQNNGPWSQLIQLKNIQLVRLKADSAIQLTDKISVTPIQVPHRDEFSETVGYSINTEKTTVLYIPDIDKWAKWERDIKKLVYEYNYLFLDGTFYSEKELPGRNMSEIPHPFVKESMVLFNGLPAAEKRKIWFIHFNHTNPLLDISSDAYKEVKNKGFNTAAEHTRINL